MKQETLTHSWTLKRQEKRQSKGRKVYLMLDTALLFSGKESGKNGRISDGTSPA